MVFIIVIILLFTFAMLRNKAQAKLYNNLNVKTGICPPHNWIYKSNGIGEYMVCEKCGMLPGTTLKEEKWSRTVSFC